MENNSRVYSSKEERISIEKRNSELINLVLDFVIKNSMSVQEIDNCMEEVKKVFYSDGLILREFNEKTAQERQVQEKQQFIPEDSISGKFSQSEQSMLSKLTIKNGILYLDDAEIRGVIRYGFESPEQCYPSELKQLPSELSVKLLVSTVEIES